MKIEELVVGSQYFLASLTYDYSPQVISVVYAMPWESSPERAKCLGVEDEFVINVDPINLFKTQVGAKHKSFEMAVDYLEKRISEQSKILSQYKKQKNKLKKLLE